MTDNERISYLEKKISQLEQQVRVIGNELAAEKEQTTKLKIEVEILKEGGNL